MAPLEIVTRPTLPKLYRSRNHGVPCFFRLQAVGTSSQFRLNGSVLETEASATRMEVSFMESDTGDNELFSVVFNPTEDHTGHAEWLSAHENIRLEWCGVEPHVYKLLAAHDILCMADLKLHTEEAICRKLLEPGLPVTRGRVNEAVARYARMRTRLKQINVSHNPCDADGPGSVRQLRELLHA
jgi:hypothetical protein